MAGESSAHGRSTRHAQAAGAWTRSPRKARVATGWDGITRPDGRAASAAALAAQGEGRQADDGGQADGEEHEDGRQGHGSSLSFWTGPRRLPGQLRDAASRPPLPVASGRGHAAAEPPYTRPYPRRHAALHSSTPPPEQRGKRGWSSSSGPPPRSPLPAATCTASSSTVAWVPWRPRGNGGSALQRPLRGS